MQSHKEQDALVREIYFSHASSTASYGVLNRLLSVYPSVAIMGTTVGTLSGSRVRLIPALLAHRHPLHSQLEFGQRILCP